MDAEAGHIGFLPKRAAYKKSNPTIHSQADRKDIAEC